MQLHIYTFILIKCGGVLIYHKVVSYDFHKNCILIQPPLEPALNALPKVIYSDVQKFTRLSAFHLPDSQPAVRPGCTRCRASKITLNNGLPHLIYETAILKMIIPLRHGDSFVLHSDAFFSIHLICINNLHHYNISCKVITTVLISAYHLCTRRCLAQVIISIQQLIKYLIAAMHEAMNTSICTAFNYIDKYTD